MPIIGHKVEQYLDIVPHDYGRRFMVTVHRVVFELHATKGWRRINHTRHVQQTPRRPSWNERAKLTRTTYTPNPAYRKSPEPEPPPIPLRAQVRHRERRRDMERAANLARLAAGDA